MKKLIVLSVFGMLAASGCATTGMGSHVGGAAIAMHKDGESATNEAGGSKRGEACSTNIAGIITMGDSSIEAAKKDGGIQRVASVDVDYFRILGFYGKACVIVKGN